MTGNPTFKQYLQTFSDSKQQLENALSETPSQVIDYKVRTYCRLMVGCGIDVKETLTLKPGHQLKVKWLGDGLQLTPTAIKVENPTGEVVSESLVYWKSSKLLKWLNANTDYITC